MGGKVIFLIVMLVWALFTLVYFSKELKELLNGDGTAKPEKKANASNDGDEVSDDEPDDFLVRPKKVTFEILEEPAKNDVEDEYLDPNLFDIEYGEMEELSEDDKKTIEQEVAEYEDENMEVLDHSAVTIEKMVSSANEMHRPTSDENSKKAYQTLCDIGKETDFVQKILSEDSVLERFERIRKIHENIQQSKLSK